MDTSHKNVKPSSNKSAHIYLPITSPIGSPHQSNLPPPTVSTPQNKSLQIPSGCVQGRANLTW